MKRIVIAPDSFKESLDADQAAKAIATGIKRVLQDVDIIEVPMSDGGEGLVQTLVKATGGYTIPRKVTGPMGKPVDAFIGILGDGVTGVVEMASASGLPLVAPSERNPLFATTYGTGELIKFALDKGCKKIIIGIGGSATNDGGAGMAQALGVRLLTVDEKEIGPGAKGLSKLDRIDIQGLDPRLKEVEILVAADVNNPLCGPHGASYVFGPQKGATPEMLPFLDETLRKYAEILNRDLRINILDMPGAGAAGGLGGGLVAFLGARIRSGVDLVLETVNLEDILQKGVDLVITGEGEINHQTSYGKVSTGVAKLAKKYNIPVLALVGSIGDGAEKVLNHGIDAYFNITSRPMTLKESIAQANSLLADVAEQCARLIKALL